MFKIKIEIKSPRKRKELSLDVALQTPSCYEAVAQQVSKMKYQQIKIDIKSGSVTKMPNRSRNTTHQRQPNNREKIGGTYG